jgi:hypothetical protein
MTLPRDCAIACWPGKKTASADSVANAENERMLLISKNLHDETTLHSIVVRALGRGI